MYENLFNKKKCNRIYRNLLSFNDCKSTEYIRELFETEKCDSFYDMSDIRKNYIKEINIDDNMRMKRIFEYNEDINDINYVRNSIVKYRKNDSKKIKQGLDWESSIWYYTTHQLDNLIYFNKSFFKKFD